MFKKKFMALLTAAMLLATAIAPCTVNARTVTTSPASRPIEVSDTKLFINSDVRWNGYVTKDSIAIVNGILYIPYASLDFGFVADLLDFNEGAYYIMSGVVGYGHLNSDSMCYPAVMVGVGGGVTLFDEDDNAIETLEIVRATPPVPNYTTTTAVTATAECTVTTTTTGWTAPQSKTKLFVRNTINNDIYIENGVLYIPYDQLDYGYFANLLDFTEGAYYTMGTGSMSVIGYGHLTPDGMAYPCVMINVGSGVSLCDHNGNILETLPIKKPISTKLQVKNSASGVYIKGDTVYGIKPEADRTVIYSLLSHNEGAYFSLGNYVKLAMGTDPIQYKNIIQPYGEKSNQGFYTDQYLPISNFDCVILFDKNGEILEVLNLSFDILSTDAKIVVPVGGDLGLDVQQGTLIMSKDFYCHELINYLSATKGYKIQLREAVTNNVITEILVGADYAVAKSPDWKVYADNAIVAELLDVNGKVLDRLYLLSPTYNETGTIKAVPAKNLSEYLLNSCIENGPAYIADILAKIKKTYPQSQYTPENYVFSMVMNPKIPAVSLDALPGYIANLLNVPKELIKSVSFKSGVGSGDISEFIVELNYEAFYVDYAARVNSAFPVGYTTVNYEIFTKFMLYIQLNKFVYKYAPFYNSQNPTEPQPVSVTVYGDVNGDGKLTIADVVMLRTHLINPTKYPITPQGLANANVIYPFTSLQPNSAVAIQDAVVEKISLPVYPEDLIPPPTVQPTTAAMHTGVYLD